jgi:hypothetical protein
MRERNTCQDCGDFPLPGERRCQRHKDLHNLREARRREDRREQGLCLPCGAPAVLDDDGVPMRYCDGCRAKNEARRLALKQRTARKRTKEANW